MHASTPLAAHAALLVASLASLALARPADAQSGGRQIGLRGGLNLTDFAGDDAGDVGYTDGLNAGGSFQVLSIGPVSIGPEIYYAEKGADRNLADGTVSFGLDYLEVPVIARLYLPGGSVARPYLQGGPSFAWNLDCGVTVDASNGSGVEGASGACEELLSGEGLRSTVEDYETGMVAGAGVDIALPGGVATLNLDGRYTRGLTRVARGPDGEDVETSNRGFTLMLGLGFGLGGRRP